MMFVWRFAYSFNIVDLLTALCTCFCCVNIYVAAIGCIAPAVYRSHIGLLLACWDMLDGGVRAHEGHLRPRMPPHSAATPDSRARECCRVMYLRMLTAGAGPKTCTTQYHNKL